MATIRATDIKEFLRTYIEEQEGELTSFRTIRSDTMIVFSIFDTFRVTAYEFFDVKLCPPPLCATALQMERHIKTKTKMKRRHTASPLERFDSKPLVFIIL